ncbi:MAG TPA: encapsulin, partial [Candidatus Binatia bacterium]|nr:encapsulin [Candidatus Binatia bacterium]
TLKLYLFTKGDIAAIEETSTEGKENGPISRLTCRGNEGELSMGEGKFSGLITAELLQQIEEAAVAAARDVISGRRLIDVEGPRYPRSDLLQIEHLKRLCARGIVKAAIEGCVVVARDVGSIVVGQDLQVSFLSSDAAHEHFSISESLILKIEAPDAICAIPAGGATSIKTT